MKIEEFDKFREHYAEMTADNVRTFYRKIHTEYPDQEYFSLDPALSFFAYADSKKVFELGGADGSLASRILGKHPEIVLWENHDIDNWEAKADDIRYRFVSDGFAWDNVIPGGFDTLVMSHVMEHISTKQASRLLRRLSYPRWVYIDYPEPPKGGWSGTCAHVSEMNTDQVYEFMLHRGFKRFMNISTGIENSIAMGFKR